MKILVTDGQYKQSLAIAAYLKAHDHDHVLVGHLSRHFLPTSIFRLRYDAIHTGDLRDVLDNDDFDLVIPVGSQSVMTVARHPTKKKVLPNIPAIEEALDKHRTFQRAESLGIPVPRTICLDSWPPGKTHLAASVGYPCVIKERIEGVGKTVAYVTDQAQLSRKLYPFVSVDRTRHPSPIAQEFVPGVGVGFFAFYVEGECKRFYVHERLREYPPSGGPSTSARTIVHADAFRYGKTILDSLDWHGVAMVEFKMDTATRGLTLLEINPKFWGSTELGLAAGINFGQLIVDCHLGRRIRSDHRPTYDLLTFRWPLDDDILSTIASRQWSGIKDYFTSPCRTNLATNGYLINALKCVRLLGRSLRHLVSS